MEDKIEQMRELMIKTALKKGLGANETIKLSKELDDLINRYEFNEKNYNQCMTSKQRNTSIDRIEF